MKQYVIGAVAMLALVTNAHAGSKYNEDDDFSDHSPPGRDSHLGFVIAGNAEFGGDSVAVVSYTNGESQPVKAGQGVTLAVGGHYQFASPKLDIMATLGYKYVTTKASNANIYIGRTVAALQVSYAFTDSWWAGAGPTWHLNNQFHGAQFAPNLKFDPALGVTIQGGWKFIALSYTSINYKDELKNKYDASNFGFGLIGRF